MCLDLLGLPLERRGAVNLDRSEWLVLEFQAVRSWAQETRADSRALAAQARQARSRRTAMRGSTRAAAGTSRDLRPEGRDQWPYLPGGAAG